MAASPYRAYGMRTVLLLVALAMASAGCATEQVTKTSRPVAAPTLIVARAGVDVSFTWPSRRGAVYSVFYSDSPEVSGARWQPLPGYINLPGTGRTMAGKDRVPPRVDRRYKLDTVGAR